MGGLAYYWVLVYKWSPSKGVYVLVEKEMLNPSLIQARHMAALRRGVPAGDPEQQALATAISIAEKYAGNLGKRESCSKTRVRGLKDMLITRAYLCTSNEDKYLVLAAKTAYPPRTVKL